jgi:hypothetical protein
MLKDIWFPTRFLTASNGHLNVPQNSILPPHFLFAPILSTSRINCSRKQWMNDLLAERFCGGEILREFRRNDLPMPQK